MRKWMPGLKWDSLLKEPYIKTLAKTLLVVLWGNQRYRVSANFMKRGSIWERLRRRPLKNMWVHIRSACTASFKGRKPEEDMLLSKVLGGPRERLAKRGRKHCFKTFIGSMRGSFMGWMGLNRNSKLTTRPSSGGPSNKLTKINHSINPRWSFKKWRDTMPSLTCWRYQISKPIVSHHCQMPLKAHQLEIWIEIKMSP